MNNNNECRIVGYPHIVYQSAVNEIGSEVVESITARGFVLVPVEVLLMLEKQSKSDLWDQLLAHSVATPIETLPSPLWRSALRKWCPTAHNLYAARLSPETPLPVMQTSQEDPLSQIDQARDGSCHPDLNRK